MLPVHTEPWGLLFPPQALSAGASATESFTELTQSA